MYFINSSLLVEVLETLLPVVVLWRLLWGLFRRIRGGTSVPLISGACSCSTSADGGALTFNVDGPPLWLDWTRGSAKKYRSMVLSIDLFKL